MSSIGNERENYDGETITYSQPSILNDGPRLTFRERYDMKKKERDLQKKFKKQSRNPSTIGIHTVRYKPQ